jgi:hypothetical protein
MEKNKMTHNKEFDYEDWGRRLESGDRSDPLLNLGARIQSSYSPQIIHPQHSKQLAKRLISLYAL